MATITALDGAKIADAVYRFEPQIGEYKIFKDPNTNQQVIYSDPNIGLQIALYQSITTGEYVIAVRGTEPFALDGDMTTNVKMFVSTLADMLPSAFIQASQFIESLIGTYNLDSSKTSIVGHSMGGSIAQYLGSATGFQTLTYNAYGIGNMDAVPEGSTANITNYITMHDFVSPLPGSQMVGTTYMLQDESLYAVAGHGITNFTSEEDWVRGYSLVDDPRSIDVIDGIGSSGLDSAYELALMLSEGREFAMINGSMDDVIYGGDINNTLISGGGNDTLIGGISITKDDNEADRLEGGADYDKYYSGNTDTIYDSDGKGEVHFEGELLTGGEKQAGDVCNTDGSTTTVYKGDGGTYTLVGNTLGFVKDGSLEQLIIENFTNGQLGITLQDNKADGGTTCSVEGKCPTVINTTFNLSFSLPVSHTTVNHSSGGGGGLGGGGGGGGDDDTPITPHIIPLMPIPIHECVNSPLYSSVGKGGGSYTSPIVLDLNRDGITSISLAASTALFDYDADGIKENTAWTQATDALLVNDINNDGLINDAGELFGNYTKNSDGTYARSGYQALNDYDSNSDGVIDANDERFSELKLWIDANQDGLTDAGELKTLTEAGVTSLNISTSDYVPMTEEGNTIIQETSFTDAQGEGVMRDVLFKYENDSTPTDGVYFDMDGNGIKEKMTTWTAPNEWMVVKDINGDGKITSGKEVVGNHMLLSNGTTAPDTIQALQTFDINHDGVIDSADNSGLAFWTDRNHNGLTDVGELEALGDAGSIQVIKLNPYQTLLSGYDNNHDGVINSSDNLYNYLYIQTNTDDSVTLYLPDNDSARAMIAGYTGGESIQTSEGEKVIKKVLFYSGSITLNDEAIGTDASETLEGSSRAETLKGMGGRDILDAGAGNDTLEGGTGSDKLLGGTGNDTYLYNRGDGKDLIVDVSGGDKIVFGEGITQDDLIIKSNGVDISIYLKEGDKGLSELTDQIIVKDWYTTGQVEQFSFSDGSKMAVQDIMTALASNAGETIYGTDASETIEGKKGNDILEGGAGDDTYFYNRGDGKDVIIDTSGTDVLQFGVGLTKDDLVVRQKGSDIIVGVKEDGVAFEDLSDKITLKNWYVQTNRIESFVFDDTTLLDIGGIIGLMMSGDDTIYGTEQGETISTLGGNDTVYASDGDDVIDGGTGDDIITGGSGNDTFIGGQGNDTLIDNSGSDTYVFNRGDGHDTIYEYNDYSYTMQDTLQFGEGITQDDLIIKQDGKNLIVGLKEDGVAFEDLSDTITIVNWNDYLNRVDTFSFSDGLNIGTEEILQMLPSDGDDVILMPTDITMDMNLQAGDDIFKSQQNLAEVIFGGSGNDTIITGGGSDTLIGGTGNDALEGGTGDDTYIFNRGDGQDTVNDTSGNDTLKFDETIIQDDLIVKQDGNDLIVALKEDGVVFEDLSDKVTITNWLNANNRVEKFTFSDGTSISAVEIVSLIASNEADTINGTELDDVIDAKDGNDSIKGNDGNDVINGGSGNDILSGGNGADVIKGGAGDDYIYADYSDSSHSIYYADILEGGTGNDTLIGGGGNDTYIFNRGDGQDTISSSAVFASNDTLQFGEGVTQDDLIIKQDDNNLIVALKEDGVAFENLSDKITIVGWLTVHGRLENFTFDDGITLSVSDMLARLATDESDAINGTELDDVIDAKGGDDIVYGHKGNDTLIGGSGDDVLIADDDYAYQDSSYTDILEGGTGNDTLQGGAGNDTYIFNKGDGQDNIYDFDDYLGSNKSYYNAGNDTLKFGEGITQDDLIIKQDGEDLIVGLKEDGVAFEDLSDKVTITNWIDVKNRIENFHFSDGSNMDVNAIMQMLPYGLNPIFGTDSDDIIIGLEGNDNIVALKGDDIIRGLDGDDTYFYNTGDGNDVITETSGTDKIVFGEGITKDDIQLELRKVGVTQQQINTTIGNTNTSHSLITLADGSYLSVWDEYSDSSDNQEIHMQRFDLSGTKIGNEIKLNNEQWTYDPKVCSLPDGNILVTWSEYSTSTINGQIFDLDGNSVSSKLDVSASPYYNNGDIIHLSNGNLVISWEESDGSNEGIFAQIIDATGTNVGEKFQVNTYTPSSQFSSHTSALNDGSFVVTWNSYGQDGSKQGIFAQKFDSDGTKIGDEFQVNTTTDGWQENSSITTLENGDFLVAWESFSEGGSQEDGIYAQRYDSNANKIGEEFEIFSNGDANYQQNVTITSLKDGGFVATWEANGEKGFDNNLIYAQYFDADGQKKGDVFQVNEIPDNVDEYVAEPQVIALDNGGFTISWKSSYTYDNFMIKQYDSNGQAVAIPNEYKENLVISFRDNPDDTITIDNLGANTLIESLQFTDGTVINSQDFDQEIGIVGLGDSKILESQVINGTSGDDIITSGEGNDLLSGGAGDDVYIVGVNSGHDVIDDIGGIDTLKFEDGITKEDLIFYQKDSNTLQIGIKELDTPFSQLKTIIEIKNTYNMKYFIENFSFSNGETLSFFQMKDFGILDGNENITGTNGNDIIDGGIGNDTLSGLFGSDVLKGGAGDDTLIGDINYTTNVGADTLEGGTGNDILQGGGGDDTYIFNRGDGQDTIFDNTYYSYYAGNDTLQFGEGITQDDLIIKLDGNDLIVALKEDGVLFADLSDKITITNWSNTNNKIENIKLSDGSNVNIYSAMGTDEDDTITASGSNDIIDAKAGNDIVYGMAGNDTLYGGAGDDTIIADSDGSYQDTAYADILEGGTGNDILQGGAGDDTYIFNRGDGQDTIFDNDSYYTYQSSYNAGNDTLQFGEGITQDDLIVKEDGNDLIVALKEDGVAFADLNDKITITNWSNTNNKIENIKLSDGTDVDLYSAMGTDADDTITASNADDFIDAKAGNDIIYAMAGNDTLIGGQGNDTLYGGNGNDTYIFNRGDGHDTIYDIGSYSYYGDPGDVLEFGEGITSDDLIIQKSDGDLIVALKEDGVAFADLSDKITIQINNIEQLSFADGSTVDLTPYREPTDGDDYISYGSENDTAYGLAGNDILQTNDGDDTLEGGLGDDTLYGGNGNDTYIFNRGDGHDTIYDTGEWVLRTIGDTIAFGEGITIDDIIVQSDGADIIVALKEDGVAFADLSDTIRILQGTVENISLSDGSIYNIADYAVISEVVSPLVLDLNGNGVTSTSLDDTNVYFDYNADGQSERTSWIERGDALLTVDLNGDGVINDGSELFGDHTKLADGTYAQDGYEAILQYDSNQDGKIDANDAKYNDLLLWKDTNLDGRSSADELSTLAQNGIDSIDLSENSINLSENGNLITYETNFTTSDGSGTMRDLWFTYDPNDTIDTSNENTAETGSYSDGFEDFTTDSTIKIDAIESMGDSGITSLTLQSRYTGNGLTGASAQTVFEGTGYTGTLSNVWLSSDTLDTQYTYTGTISADIQALPSIDGSGNVIGLQEVMNEKSDLAASVEAFQTLSESGNLTDFEANIDSIIEGWALYDLSGEVANSTPPIVLDLNGDGVTSVSLDSSAAYFDYDGDGRREHTAWIQQGDALLAVDINDDGVVNNGSELFGNYTLLKNGAYAADGYEAMAQYDSNGDSILDANDEEFSKLKLWIDANGNGKSDEGELSTLAENGISAINLSRADGTTFTQITEEGNMITNETNYVASEGDGTVRDVWFSYDGSDTIATSSLSDSDEKKIAIVENFYGRRLSDEERNSVEVIANVLDQYDALRYDTIAKIITNKLYGEGFPNCTFLHDALNNTLSRVVGGTASTTETLLSVNLLAALLKRDHANVLKDIYPEYLNDPTIAYLLGQNNISLGYENGALIGHIGDRYFGTSAAEDYDFSYLDGVRAFMSGGDDNIVGTSGIDEIIGGEGNDVLNGNGGNDVLEGGQGDDTLIGGDTQNVYIYSWGDGNDTIIDAGSDDNAPDTLRFTNLDVSRVSVERSGDDMILHIMNELGEVVNPFDGAYGTVVIKDGYTAGKIENFYFQDQRYSFDEVLVNAVSDTNYYFANGDGNIVIDDIGGDDTLYFGTGITKQDIISVVDGNDLKIGIRFDDFTVDELPNTVTIKNYADAIEHFVFEDGSTLSSDEVINLVYTNNDLTNDAPVTTETEAFTLQDIREQTGQVEATDADGDTLSYVVTTAAEHGTLSVDETGAWTYRVDDLYIGEDSAVITVDDGNGGTVTKTLNFNALVSAPTLADATAQLLEDNNANGTFNVINPIGGTLTYEVITTAANGAFTVDENGAYSYNPSQDYNGTDAVTLKVTNEYGLSTTSTLNFEIEAVNDAPEANVDTATTEENSSLRLKIEDILANDTDVDTNDTMQIIDVVAPANKGTVALDNTTGELVFEPGSDFDHLAEGQSEDVSVMYTIEDSAGATSSSEIIITITGTNDKPVLEVMSPIETEEDATVVTGVITSTDVDDNATATYTTTAAIAGFVLNSDGSYSFNPADDAYQSLAKDERLDITIPVTVTDDQNATDSKNLIITVVGTNDIPTVENIDTTELIEDSAIITGQVNAQDIDNEAVLNYSAPAIAGFILNNDGSYSFDAADEAYQHLAEGAVETITIPVTVSDEYSATVTTDIVFKVTGTNDKPVLEVMSPIETEEDATVVTGVITSTDVDDNATATYTTTAAIAGFVLNSDGSYSFNPADDAYQSLAKDERLDITIPVTVTDDQNAIDSKNLIITVIGTNDAPVVADTQSFTLTNIRNLDGKIEATDVEGDVLNYTISTDAQHGVVSIDENGNWSYKADGSFNGNDSAVITVDDGNGGSVTSTLNFTVKGYIYEGEDLVIDDVSGDDMLVMDTVNKDELSFARSANDLQISVKDESVITLKNYFTNINAGVETLQTAQGDINLSRDVINNAFKIGHYGFFMDFDSKDHLISGTNSHDWLNGNSGNDIIFGGSGNDYINGNNGNDLLVGGNNNDSLYGGNGDDNLYGELGNDFLNGGDGSDTLIGADGNDSLLGESGDDWLSGGIGNDYLEGGKGNDTYHFEKGDGQDYIFDNKQSSFWWLKNLDGGDDTITFGKDVTKDDVSFTMNHGDLFIQYGEGDIVQVRDQDDSASQIERIELADGNYLTNNDIDLVIQQISAFGTENGMHHITNNDVQNNTDLMQIVSSAWHQ